jgi:hypothetical protein
MIPKTIYMTYKQHIPSFVFNKWKSLNPDWNIDFSLDYDCIHFLRNNFSSEIANLFISIPEGMYKADLWRLCKLYINGGVYADIDLVPLIPLNDLIKENASFYTALNGNTCYQAILISEPKNPLLLGMIHSFINNRPWTYHNGPTVDMFLYIQNINPQIVHHPYFKMYLNDKIIPIGRSDHRIKTIDFNENIENLTLKSHPYSDNFKFTKIEPNKLEIMRLDAPHGWEHHHSLYVFDKNYKGIPIEIQIGSSDTNEKIINTYLKTDIDKTIEITIKEHPYNDQFSITWLNNNQLHIQRIDCNEGWGHNHSLIFYIKENKSVLFFQEIQVSQDQWYVYYHNQQILKSKDVSHYGHPIYNSPTNIKQRFVKSIQNNRSHTLRRRFMR